MADGIAVFSSSNTAQHAQHYFAVSLRRLLAYVTFLKLPKFVWNHRFGSIEFVWEALGLNFSG
jgi:hypothetical protein